MNYKKSKRKILAVSLVFTVFVVAMVAYGSTASSWWGWWVRCDIVIKNGRVMDPLTRTDKIATVGIRAGKIAFITTNRRLTAVLCSYAKRVIDATGLVVAPGFINIHGHEGIIEMTMNFSVRDGVTTNICGNCGGSPYPLAEYFDELELMGMFNNYAAYTGLNTLRGVVGVPDPVTPSTPEQLAEMVQLVAQEMEAGALGVSYGPFYGPGCTYEEMLDTASKCAELGGGAAIHVRYFIDDVTGVNEAIQLATESSVPLIISHMGGPAFGNILFPAATGKATFFIAKALEKGVKLAADSLLYVDWMLPITSPSFEGASQELLDFFGYNIDDFLTLNKIVMDGSVYMDYNERFSSLDQFNFVREKALAGEIAVPSIVCLHRKMDVMWFWLSQPFVMVENDGAASRDPTTGEVVGYPRVAGAFSKFLGYWVRELGVTDLMTGLYKTSTMAALWLGLDKKGRVQVGCDADLVLFDPYTIINTADYQYAHPEACLTPPIGLPYVIVNGKLVVNNGELTGERPGEVIRRTWEVPGVIPGPWIGRDGLGLLDEEGW